MAEPINLIPSTNEPIDLSAPGIPDLSTDTATNRADRYNYAAGDNSPGQDVIFNQIVSGTEDNLRKYVASKNDIEVEKTRQSMLTHLMQNSKGPLDQRDVSFIRDLTVSQISDPNTNLEDLYSKRLLKDTYGSEAGYSGPKPRNLRSDAYSQDENVSNALDDVFQQTVAIRQVAQKLYEDLGTQFQDENFFGKAGDIGSYGLQSVLPFVRQYALHNVVKPPFKSSFLTGNNLPEQYASIMAMPLREGAAALAGAYNDLKQQNVFIARDFLQGFLTYSNSDAFLDNAFNVVDIASFIYPAAKIVGKAAAGSIKGVRSSSAGADALSEAFRAGRSQEKQAAAALDSTEADRSASAAIQDLDKQGKSTQEIATELGLEPHDVERIKEYNNSAPESADQAMPPVAQYAESLKGTVKAAATDAPDVAAVAASAGKQDMAAATHIAEAIAAKIPDQLPQRVVKPLLDSLPSGSDPGGWFRGAFKLSREYSDQILGRVENELGALVKGLGLGIDTLSPDALRQAMLTGKTRLEEEVLRHGVNDSVIDYQWLKPESSPDGTAYTVLRLGMPGGKNFGSEKHAIAFAEKFGLVDAEPRSSGDGWILQISRPVDETDHEIKPFLVSPKSQTPPSWLNTVLGGWNKFRTSSERVSEEQRGLRVSAVNRYAEMLRLTFEGGRPVQALSKAERTRLSRFMDATRRYEDIGPDGQPIKGLQFNTQGEFETAWEDIFKTAPNAAESEAYMATRNIGAYEKFIKDLGRYHVLARQGVREWTFGDSKYFAAKQVKEVPWDATEGTVRVIDGDEVHTYNINKIGAKSKKDIDTKLGDNWTIVQTVDPFDHGGGRPVNFIVTKDAESRNLSWNQSSFNTSDHIKYDYPAYTKQGKVAQGSDTVWYHSGDNTVMPGNSLAESGDNAKVMNQLQSLYKAKDLDAFKALVEGKLPEWDWEAILNKFRNGTFSKDIPFVAVRSGESSMRTETMRALYGGQIRSWQDSPFNLMKGSDFEFTGRRGWDITGVQNLADEDNPILSSLKPRLIDPLPMMSQAMNRAIRNRFFQSYQLRSAEHFVEEFAPVLEGGLENIERLRLNPLAILSNPKYVKDTQNRALLARAKGYQDAAMNLIGTTTEWGRWDRWMRGQLLDSIFNTRDNPLTKAAVRTVGAVVNPKSILKGGQTDAYFYEHVLPRIPNPVQFARQVAFHTKLGLFNPLQLFLQAQTFTNTMALAPKSAGPGVAAGILMQKLGVGGLNAANIDHFANLASKLGWKADDFKEAYDFMTRSGIHNIGPQHAWRSDSLDPDIFKSSVGSFLDKGLFFFNTGERFNHMAGFGTAYHEWRTANPLEKLTRANEELILARYDDLTGNMTHASSSALNRGFGSVAGQFFSYQERIAELLLGKRLTAGEKARAFAVYSAMYGVPVGLGAFTTYPWYEDARQYALKKGATNNAFVETLMQGIPEVMFHHILGEEVNFGNRYGANGLPLWDDVIKGDKTIAQIMTGATGSILGEIFKTSIPVWRDVGQYITDNKNASAPVLLSDVQNLLGNVSTLSNAMKAYTAISAHKYMDKGLIVVDNDVTTLDGLMMGVLGITPSKIDDVRFMKQAIDGKNNAQTYYRQEATRYWKLSMGEKDQTIANQYRQKSRTLMLLGDFTLKERADIVHQAMRQPETSLTTTKRAFDKEFPDAN